MPPPTAISAHYFYNRFVGRQVVLDERDDARAVVIGSTDWGGVVVHRDDDAGWPITQAQEKGEVGGTPYKTGWYVGLEDIREILPWSVSNVARQPVEYSHKCRECHYPAQKLFTSVDCSNPRCRISTSKTAAKTP